MRPFGAGRPTSRFASVWPSLLLALCITSRYIKISKRKRYVSEKRNAPRIMQALDVPMPGEPRKQGVPLDPKRGILTFRHVDGELTNIFRSSTAENELQIQQTHRDDVELANRCLDLQYKIASEFFWIIDHEPYASTNTVSHVLTPCFKNNLVALQSAQLLTKSGLYSHARPIFRMAFESLMIAKFCSTNHEAEIYDKWIDGKIIYFTNGVIKKIIKPEPSRFSQFWSVISEYTHSSIYAMQPDSCIENVKEQMDLNFLLMHMLSECNYHILNSHMFTKSLRYYQNRYGDPKRLSSWREELRKTYSALRQTYNQPTRRFVRDFKAAWEVAHA